MYEEANSPPEIIVPAREPGNILWAVVAAAMVLYLGISSYYLYDLSHRLSSAEHEQQQSAKEIADLRSELKATGDTLAAKVGITRKELAARTAGLQRAQRDAVSRLTEQQKEQITAVSGEVTGVKTDVASTRSDLEATKMKLERAIGDLGMQSGLIARTRDELEVLKHRGDRNYYEFTLLKGKSPTPVSTVSLQLKKADAKRSKFTLNVIADDKTYEKKDRTANEPLQFYTGREHLMYEVVVNTVEKNKIAGYLATPKAAPQPVQQ
jgi:hypothetical protein